MFTAEALIRRLSALSLPVEQVYESCSGSRKKRSFPSLVISAKSSFLNSRASSYSHLSICLRNCHKLLRRRYMYLQHTMTRNPNNQSERLVKADGFDLSLNPVRPFRSSVPQSSPLSSVWSSMSLSMRFHLLLLRSSGSLVDCGFEHYKLSVGRPIVFLRIRG